MARLCKSFWQHSHFGPCVCLSLQLTWRKKKKCFKWKNKMRSRLHQLQNHWAHKHVQRHHFTRWRQREINKTSTFLASKFFLYRNLVLPEAWKGAEWNFASIWPSFNPSDLLYCAGIIHFKPTNPFVNDMRYHEKFTATLNISAETFSTNFSCSCLAALNLEVKTNFYRKNELPAKRMGEWAANWIIWWKDRPTFLSEKRWFGEEFGDTSELTIQLEFNFSV